MFETFATHLSDSFSTTANKLEIVLRSTSLSL